MYEILDADSFKELKVSPIYALLKDISINLSDYMRLLSMAEEYSDALYKATEAGLNGHSTIGKYCKCLKIGSNKIGISAWYHDFHRYLLEISVTSDSLLVKFFIVFDGDANTTFARDPLEDPIILYDHCLFEDYYKHPLGIDIDRIPELIEINNQLIEKIKQLKDSELYEKDKQSALKEMNVKSFKDRLKDICTILKE